MTEVVKEMKAEALPHFMELSDAGQFSLGALCAISLKMLFEEDFNDQFKKNTLSMILQYMKQPEQVEEAIKAILDGQGIDDSDPYVDILLKEEILPKTKSAEPLVTDFITMAIQKGNYDARFRVLIKHVSWQLRVTWDTMEEIEGSLAEILEAEQYEVSEDEAKEKAKKARNSKFKRYALIGLATIGGGTIIGLTGGLAAPLVAAGAGAIIGGAGAAALGTTAGVAVIGSLFGVAGAGLAGHKMKRRVGAIEEFMFEPLICGHALQTTGVSKQLHITIAVTGWLTSKVQDFRQPWPSLAESREQYSLKWESKYLLELGKSFEYITSIAVSMAAQEALKFTVLSGILAAIAWPAALVSAANVIDNPWSVCLNRSNAAGKQLAEVLLSREQGKRPVTLIGYSLGARVIFSCLEELAKRKGSEGIVEDVILLGAPVSGDPKYWQVLTKVVAGKIVNGYCRGDWLLKFLYRTSSVQLRIAGLRPVKWENRRMHNIDLSDVVSGHMDYQNQLTTIMKAVGVRTRDEISMPKKTQSAPVTPSSSKHLLQDPKSQSQSAPVSRSTTVQNINLASISEQGHSVPGTKEPKTEESKGSPSTFKSKEDVLNELSRSISNESYAGTYHTEDKSQRESVDKETVVDDIAIKEGVKSLRLDEQK
ncbi:transmembrane and coiled-coil domain-containing protein 4 isoform X1 [Patella vulgata]|uniref:transmembrane and coiled-coil domain-containing protein 4 isoform X1 n=2 Tax=Patella vulgata TaxID=6465 RepID=UPI0021804045|nr:transmembrane and coiled-coil domain-containing protein 4 isoform X1 [Patella vulgata]